MWWWSWWWSPYHDEVYEKSIDGRKELAVAFSKPKQLLFVDWLVEPLTVVHLIYWLWLALKWVVTPAKKTSRYGKVQVWWVQFGV